MGDFIREHKILTFTVGTFIFLFISVGLFFILDRNPQKNPAATKNLAGGEINIGATGSFGSSISYSTDESNTGGIIHSYIVKPDTEAVFQAQADSAAFQEDSDKEEIFTLEETPAIKIFKDYFGGEVFDPNENEHALDVAKELASSGLEKIKANDMKSTLDTMKSEGTTDFTPWSISKKYHELKKEPLYEKTEKETGEVFHVYDLVDKKIEILETPAMQAWSDVSGVNVFDPANTPNAFDVAKIMSDESVSRLTYNDVFELFSLAKKEGANLNLVTLAEKVNESFAENGTLSANMQLALNELGSLTGTNDNASVGGSSVDGLLDILKGTSQSSNKNTNSNNNTNSQTTSSSIFATNQNSNTSANPWSSNSNANGSNINQNSFFNEPSPAGQIVSSSGGDDSGGGEEKSQDPMQMIQQVVGIMGMLKMLPEILGGILGAGEQTTGGGKQGGDSPKGP